MSYDSLRNPQNYERKPFSPSPDYEIDDNYTPKCCGVWMQDDGGDYFYCDECGKEVQK